MHSLTKSQKYSSLFLSMNWISMTGNNDKIFQVLLALFFQGAKLKSGIEQVKIRKGCVL